MEYLGEHDSKGIDRLSIYATQANILKLIKEAMIINGNI